MLSLHSVCFNGAAALVCFVSCLVYNLADVRRHSMGMVAQDACCADCMQVMLGVQLILKAARTMMGHHA